MGMRKKFFLLAMVFVLSFQPINSTFAAEISNGVDSGNHGDYAQITLGYKF